MNRTAIVALGALLLASAAGAPAFSDEMFSARAENLNGAALSLPADFQAERSVLLVGFHHGEQPVMDAWRDGLRLEVSASDWLEVPVIGPVNPVVQSMIRGGMRGRFKSTAERAHVVPLFQTPQTVAASLGVATEGVSVVVIDRSGHVLARQSGAFGPAKAVAVLSVLHAAP